MVYLKTNTPAVNGKAIRIQNVSIPVESGASVGQKTILLKNNIALPLQDFPNGTSPEPGDKCLLIPDKKICFPVYNKEVSRFPEEGLVFYASLSKDVSVSETGQSISKYGDVDYLVTNGIPCAYFNGSSYLKSSLEDIENSCPRTFSAWIKDSSTNSDSYRDAVVYGAQESLKNFGIIISNKNYFSGSIYGHDLISDIMNDNEWHHVLFSYDGTKASLYIDGQKNKESVLQLETSISDLFIGSESPDLVYPWTGYIASVRVYERALADEEVQVLAQEFKPIEE